MSKHNFRERGVDMPYLYLEADGWDTRFYSAGAMRTRIESFAEILRMHKEEKEAEKLSSTEQEEKEPEPVRLPDSWIKAGKGMGVSVETTADLTVEMMAGVGIMKPKLLNDLKPEHLLALDPDAVAVLSKRYLKKLDPELLAKLAEKSTLKL
jgi:hypothetical protein